MDKMKGASPIRPLPGRGALNDLAKTNRSILNYAKAVPTMPAANSTPTILMLGAKGPR